MNPRIYTEAEIAHAWADFTLYLSQYTPANSPTYASRALGYIGLTMYETMAYSLSGQQSIAGQLNQAPTLPSPDSKKKYYWDMALNAGQAQILRHIYRQTSDENKVKIDSIEGEILAHFMHQYSDQEPFDRSIQWGKDIADAIFEWSKTDGGHRAYLRNFDKSFSHKVFPGSWKPPLYAQSFSHHPLHPYWGDNRTFLIENSDLPIPEMIPFDTAQESPYYQEFIQVYKKDLVLTQEEKEIAIWWGDDPDDSFTPPGHSYYLAGHVLRKKKADISQCVRTYAKIGLATADAFINCWKWKYHYFSERPNTFIPQYIDPEWESFWPDPPFPAFPSGHAIQAAAAATVLEGEFGKSFTFTDSSHVDRPRDEIRDTDFRARTFTDFWAIAEETADSRFYGGIHTPQDNTVGLREGKAIAERVNQLKWGPKTN